MTLSWASATDVGRVRENNEDSVWPDPGAGVGTRPLVVAVADGMGGHAAGEVASRTAIEAAISVGGNATVRVQAANVAVIDTASRQSRLSGMGTTLTLAIVTDDGAVDLAHVGDSRAYLFTPDGMSKITTDHSYVAEMIEAGKLTAEEAETHPYRSVVTRGIGLDKAVSVDTHTLTMTPGSRLLLCTDGVTAMLDDATLAEVVGAHDEPAAAVAAVIEAANLAGGVDNISAVVVDLT